MCVLFIGIHHFDIMTNKIVKAKRLFRVYSFFFFYLKEVVLTANNEMHNEILRLKSFENAFCRYSYMFLVVSILFSAAF